jgi:uncharacterized repeat protein (TIGR02543 family)
MVFTTGSSYTRLANLNLYARWIAETYTVTFAANGGSGSAPNTISNVTIGETFTAPSTTMTLTGSSFAGWSDGVRTYLPGNVVTVGGSNMVLTAIWNGTQYVVIYSLNGGTGTAPTSPNFYLSDTFTIASQGNIAKVGYTFLGWVESGTPYIPGTTFTMPARNITFIAQWPDLHHYLRNYQRNWYTITYIRLIYLRRSANFTTYSGNPGTRWLHLGGVGRDQHLALIYLLTNPFSYLATSVGGDHSNI